MHPFFPGLNFNPKFSFSSPSAARRDKKWDCGQFITGCLCRSFLLQGRFLTLLPCSSVWSLLWETFLSELPGKLTYYSDFSSMTLNFYS